tara:strand:+ start:2989 stop:3609 length:621 start_codon:yes stop_codon:yes gene_type:complete
VAIKVFLKISLLLLLFGCVPINSASAHTALISSIPASKSELSQIPKEVSLIFDEELINIANASSISVTDSFGREVTKGKTRIFGSQANRTLAQSKATGVFIVSYRVVSEDGHVVKENYKFTVKEKTSPQDLNDNSSEELSPAVAESPLSTSLPSPSKSNEVEITEFGSVEVNELSGDAPFMEQYAGYISLAIGVVILFLIWKKSLK